MSTPSEYFISAAQEFLNAQANTRLNEQQMEKLFTDVLQKGKEYKEKFEAECEKRKLLEKAVLQFRSVIDNRKEENLSLSHQLTECKTSFKEKERELQEKCLSIQWKLNKLKRNLIEVIEDQKDDNGNTDESGESQNWINERLGLRQINSA